MIEKDEEKSHWLGPKDPRNDMEVSFLAFVFVSYIQELELKKACNLELPVGTNLKGPTKASSL